MEIGGKIDGQIVCISGKVGDEYSREDERVSNTRGQKEVESQNNVDARKTDVEEDADADADCDIDDVGKYSVDFDAEDDHFHGH